MNNLTFTVQLDCTERLERCLTAIAESLKGVKQVQPMAEQPRTVAVEEPKAETEEPKAEVEEPKAEVEEPKAETEEPKAEVEEPKVEEITDADLRTIMRETRERVLGENVNDAIMKKALNDRLREQVASYGCHSSTDLNQEQRVHFKAFCDSLQPMEVGPEPF